MACDAEAQLSIFAGLVFEIDRSSTRIVPTHSSRHYLGMLGLGLLRYFNAFPQLKTSCSYTSVINLLQHCPSLIASTRSFGWLFRSIRCTSAVLLFSRPLRRSQARTRHSSQAFT